MKSLILAALAVCGTVAARGFSERIFDNSKFLSVMDSDDSEITFTIPNETIIKGQFYKEQEDTIGEFTAKISAKYSAIKITASPSFEIPEKF